jgi:hypothetical protein
MPVAAEELLHLLEALAVLEDELEVLGLDVGRDEVAQQQLAEGVDELEGALVRVRVRMSEGGGEGGGWGQGWGWGEGWGWEGSSRACTVPASLRPTVRMEASCCSSSLICHDQG